MARSSGRHRKRRRRPFQHRTPPGSSPGLLVSDGAPSSARIHTWLWTPDHLEETSPRSVSELKTQVGRDGFLWVDIDEVAGVDVVREIGEIFGLHPLSLEDVIHVHQRAKVEEYETYCYVVVRMVIPGESFQSEQVSLFLSDNWLVTFQSLPGDCLGDVRNRLRDPHSLLRKSGTDFLLYRLIDAIIDGYFPLLGHLDERMSVMEDEIDAGNGETAMRELHVIRRDLRDIRGALWPQREAIGALMRATIRHVSPATRVFLRDCADHTLQLLDVVDSLRDTCGEVRDLYLSQLTRKTGEVTKVLTVIATLFMPISFVAGLYGMNFDPSKSPWNMPELRWTYGYPFALGLMLALEAGLITFLIRRYR